MALEFHTPYSGDWLVIIDTQTGETVYEGHGDGDEIIAVMNHLGVDYGYTEHPDKEFEEKYC